MCEPSATTQWQMAAYGYKRVEDNYETASENWPLATIQMPEVFFSKDHYRKVRGICASMEIRIMAFGDKCHSGV